jgi:hypothetical protein
MKLFTKANILDTLFNEYRIFERVYAHVLSYTYRARPRGSLKCMRGNFDFFNFYMTSFTCLASGTGGFFDNGYLIDCLGLFVCEDTVLGFHPTGVVPVPRSFRNNLSSRRVCTALFACTGPSGGTGLNGGHSGERVGLP